MLSPACARSRSRRQVEANAVVWQCCECVLYLSCLPVSLDFKMYTEWWCDGFWCLVCLVVCGGQATCVKQCSRFNWIDILVKCARATSDTSTHTHREWVMMEIYQWLVGHGPDLMEKLFGYWARFSAFQARAWVRWTGFYGFVGFISMASNLGLMLWL